MDDREFFQLIPIRQFEWERDAETQKIIILRPKYLVAWAQKLTRLITGQPFFKIKLDALGSLIWENCDGEHTVQEIYELLQKAFPEEENLKERYTLFVKRLAREKFITLLQKVSESNSPTLQE